MVCLLWTGKCDIFENIAALYELCMLRYMKLIICLATLEELTHKNTPHTPLQNDSGK